MSISVRSASTADVPALARMNEQLVEDQRSGNPFSRRQFEERFREWLQADWQIDLFLERGEVVGYTVYQMQPDRYRPGEEIAYVRQFFIERGCRRRGLGSHAFHALRRRRFPDARLISLDVLATNPGGRQFWEQLGFEPYFVNMISANPPRTVRRPRLDEAGAINQLHRDTVRRVNSRDYSEQQIAIWLGNRKTDLTEELTQTRHWWVCVDDDDALLGVGTLVDNKVTGLYVHADHHTEGIGSAILARMEDQMRAEGVTEVLVESTITAAGFYERMGYREIDRAQVGPAQIDVVNMRKQLARDPASSQWRQVDFPDAQGQDVLEIGDERAAVLLEPLRWRVLEAVGAGSTVGHLADALEITDARLLYHLRRLAEAGVIRLEQTGSSAGHWRCVPVARRLRVRDFVPREEKASDAMPPSVVGDFNQGARELREGLYGQSRSFSVNHNRSRLSEEQAAEFNRRLLALIEEFFPPGRGDRSGIKYGFHAVFTPIDLHPLDESTEDE